MYFLEIFGFSLALAALQYTKATDEIPRFTFWKLLGHSLAFADLQYIHQSRCTTTTCAAVSLALKCMEDRERNDDDEISSDCYRTRTNNSSRAMKEVLFQKQEVKPAEHDPSFNIRQNPHKHQRITPNTRSSTIHGVISSSFSAGVLHDLCPGIKPFSWWFAQLISGSQPFSLDSMSLSSLSSSSSSDARGRLNYTKKRGDQSATINPLHQTRKEKKNSPWRKSASHYHHTTPCTTSGSARDCGPSRSSS
jgi:hypothetical protein